MLRLPAAALLALVVAFPLAALPAGPVAWLAGLALVLGGVGVVVLSVTLVTVGGSLALVAYTLTLVIMRPAVDPVAAAALGAALVLLLALVHLAAHLDGAAVDRAVVARQVRGWLAVVALGVAVAGALTAGAIALAATVNGATLPVVVVAAALGAVLTAAGVTALVTARDRD